MQAQTATPRIVATVADLVAGASGRVRIRPGDARSGSVFERVEIDGRRYFCKAVSYSSDWIMRVTGDRDYRTFRLWRSGLLHRLPACIDHAIEAMALEGTRPDAVLGILMRDVVAPQWYVELKQGSVAAMGTADAMAATARAAGLSEVRLVERRVDVGIDTATALVEYRFGQAHYAAWLAAFPVEQRAELQAAIAAAVEPQMEPYRPTVIFLAGRVP